MFVSAFLSIVGLGFLVYVLFSLAVYALPFFVAVTVGMYVYDTEAGVLAALVAAMFAGAFTLIIGQIVFAKVQSVPVRLLIASLYAAPAGVAGFSAIKKAGRWPSPSSEGLSSRARPGCGSQASPGRRGRTMYIAPRAPTGNSSRMTDEPTPSATV